MARLLRWVRLKLQASHFLTFTLIFFLAGFFFFPDDHIHRLFFYFFVILPFLFLLDRTAINAFYKNNILIISLVLLGYIALSVVWTQNLEVNHKNYYDTARYFFMVVVFLAVIVYLAQKDDRLFEKIIFWSGVVASISAIVSFIAFYAHHPFPKARLDGIFWNGYLNYCVMPATYYGFLVIGTIYKAVYDPGYKNKVFFSLISVIIIVFILLTQSRGPLLALVVTLVLVFGWEKRWKTIAAIIFLTVAWLVLGECSNIGIRAFVSYGVPHRIAIWKATLGQIADSLWFGRGYLTNIQISAHDRIWNLPHCMFLSLVLKTGIIGGILFVVLILTFLINAFRYYRRTGDWRYLAMLVFIMIATNFHKMRIFYKPGMSWLVFWLPMTILAVKMERINPKNKLD